jgi:hypothetical protein
MCVYTGYMSTTIPHLWVEHKELEGDFRFLLGVSNWLTSFLSPGLTTISFRTSKQFIVFRVVCFMCLKITVSWNTRYKTVCKNQEVSGRRLWLVWRYEEAYRLSKNRKCEQKIVCSLIDWNSSLAFILLLRRERQLFSLFWAMIYKKRQNWAIIVSFCAELTEF